MRLAVALLYRNALASSITLPMEILRAASEMAGGARSSEAQVSMRLAGLTLDPVESAGGISLQPQLTVDELAPADLLLLPAIWRNPRPTLRACQALISRLPELASAGMRICAVGTSSYLLAEAGLLQGRHATTHWNYFRDFARRYPDVDLKTRHLITQADNLYCVGSVNSIADLMVHLVEDWYGSAVARAVENQFSPEIRRPFEAAAYQDQTDALHHDEVVIEVQQWLRDSLAEPASIVGLARRAGLSPRTLGRRFRQATGTSPQAYLQQQRITTARELLRSSNLSVNEISWRVGLQDVSYFSQLFKRHCSMSPGAYRHMVRGKLFTPSN